MAAIAHASTLNEEACWQAVVERRASARGLFVVAVRTTGVFCRAGCPARVPKRQNVAFYASARQAAAAGYRPCKRCRPSEALSPEQDVVRRICRRLEAADGVPTLDELSAEFGLSKFHLQRLFRRAVGVSPRAYASGRRAERVKQALSEGDGVAGAAYASGFGSGSRLYAESDGLLGMTPGVYRRRGSGMRIAYTIVDSRFGRLLVGATERGVSAVNFGDRDAALEDGLRHEYPAAEIVRDDGATRRWVRDVLRAVDRGEATESLPLDIRATAFRLRVWQELRRIPRGETRTYAQVARAIGEPKAARAVGQACGANPVAVLIPCHRVVSEGGGLGGYASGIARRRRILRAEGVEVSG